MKLEKKELQKAVEQLGKSRDYFDQQIWEKEMQYAKKYEEVGEMPSSETQGQIVGARESLNGRENMAQEKSKERWEEPLGTMSYQTSSKRSPPFCLLIGARKLV